MFNKEIPRLNPWPERHWPRVAFVAHALLPQDPSTTLISERLGELEKPWWPGGEAKPGYIRWFSFPVEPPKGATWRPVWVDFYIIPVLAHQFLAECRAGGRAFGWSKQVAFAALAEACQDKVEITVGWGALTKNATNHGRGFVRCSQRWKFSSTHGDAGTAALVIEAIRKAGIKQGFRIAVLGANGVIGSAVAHALVQLSPDSILLVGKPDKDGEKKNLTRLSRLQMSVRRVVPPDGVAAAVDIHQNKSQACLEQQSQVVVVATNGMLLNSAETPERALVLDLTTPAACQPDPSWVNRMVLSSGGGHLPQSIIPRGFGALGGRQLWDVGAGGSQVLWGCTVESIVRAAVSDKRHIVGQEVALSEVEWCRDRFAELSIEPQPPRQFGVVTTWAAVREFIGGSRYPFSQFRITDDITSSV